VHAAEEGLAPALGDPRQDQDDVASGERPRAADLVHQVLVARGQVSHRDALARGDPGDLEDREAGDALGVAPVSLLVRQRPTVARIEEVERRPPVGCVVVEGTPGDEKPRAALVEPELGQSSAGLELLPPAPPRQAEDLFDHSVVERMEGVVARGALQARRCGLVRATRPCFGSGTGAKPSFSPAAAKSGSHRNASPPAAAASSRRPFASLLAKAGLEIPFSPTAA
jgi:hypothetical protein